MIDFKLHVAMFEVTDCKSPCLLFLKLQVCTYLKSRYTLVTLPRNVAPYRDRADGTREHVTYQKLVTGLRYGLVRCAVGIRSSHQRDDTVTARPGVDGQRDSSPQCAASCKDITRAPVTNWEPQCVTLAGYCYTLRHGMKVQLVTPYRVSHLQRYGVTVRGNVTSV
jgi:hypothetical protein